MGISASQIGRILADLDLRPHGRSWLTRSDDPKFTERADVCGLYLRAPDDNALVLSIDEKTAIPARTRRHPTERRHRGRRATRVRVRPSRHRLFDGGPRRAHRRGAGHRRARNDADYFIAFLEQIDTAYPPRARRPSRDGQRRQPHRQ